MPAQRAYHRRSRIGDNDGEERSGFPMFNGLTGPEPSSPRPDSRELRFAVDCMLGSLAKWMLILGYDVLYLRKVEDSVLVERARAEDRIVVTRDRRLTERRLARPF